MEPYHLPFDRLKALSKVQGRRYSPSSLGQRADRHSVYRLVVISFLAICLSMFSFSAAIAGSTHGPDLIDEALQVIGMQRSDLSMRADLYPIGFPITRFRKWMERPLTMPGAVQKQVRSAFRAACRPERWILEMATMGDLGTVNFLPQKRGPRPPILCPLPVKKAVYVLLDAIYTANTRLSLVQSSFTAGQMALLETHLYPHACQGKDSPEGKGELLRSAELKEAVSVANKVNRGAILEAAVTLIRALIKARNLLAQDRELQQHTRSVSLMTDLGRVIIGGTGPDLHEGPASLIVDLGGNDTYKGEVASGTGGRSALVLDLGGDDVYVGGARTQACGIWGIGILWDVTGNDLYRAGDCSQGAGLLGLGLLMDGGGADSYLGGKYVQAASTWGWAGLLDLDGDDLYRCQSTGQAFAGSLGISFLCDLKGNDRYLSGSRSPDPRETHAHQSFSQGFAYGLRNLSAGGFAVLADQEGNDLYQCQYFGQGASYWMGIGVLYDENGRDTYVARRYAQGAGIHFSLGALMDVGGDDHTASWGVSQGCGHDYGIGILLNGEGDDTYVSDWLSMGASQANGVGIFADNAGDDGYDSKQGMPVAHLVEGRRAGGIGLFLDAGGKDRYSKYGSDNSVWGHNRWEVGVDQERGGVSGINLPHRPDPLPANRSVKIQRAKEQAHLRSMLALSRSEPLPLRVEGMLSVASHWGFEREIPKDAQENLLAMPPSRSVPAMVELIPTPDVMALRFMRRFFAVHAFYAVPELIKKANGPDPMVRGRALHYLGGLKDTRALKTCGEALSDRSWRVRSAAARALGEMLNHDRLSHLVPMRAAFILARRQKDSNPIVHYLSDRDRTAAVISVLVRTLSLRYDEYVRYERMALGREGTSKDLAVRVYGRLGKVLPVLDQWIKDIQGSAAIAQRLMACLKDPDPAVRASGAYALGQIRYRKALPELTALLKDPALWVRDGTALSLRLFGDDCIDVLGRAMAWEGASFRIIAIDLLGRVNSRRARELINRYGRDRDPNVRRSANQALSSQRAGP